MTALLSQLLAQEDIEYPFPGRIRGQSGSEFFRNFIPALVTLGFVVGAVAFVFVLITGGLQLISSGGDKAAFEKGKGKVFAALTGIFILLLLFGFINLMEAFFDISLTSFNIDDVRLN